jgi:hypothetical protein
MVEEKLKKDQLAKKRALNAPTKQQSKWFKKANDSDSNSKSNKDSKSKIQSIEYSKNNSKSEEDADYKGINGVGDENEEE